MAVTYSQNGVIVKPTGFDIIGGKKYKTVQMPDGKIWLAENLDFKFCTIGDSGTPSTANAWYYNNDESTYGWNGYKCGLLYNWYAVKVLNDNRSELCPGWHVPSTTEWDALISSIGTSFEAAKKLNAVNYSVTSNWPSGWNGTDDYEFSVLPAGSRGDRFGQLNEYGCFWTSSNNHISQDFNNNDTWQYTRLSAGHSVSLRLVRDAT